VTLADAPAILVVLGGGRGGTTLARAHAAALLAASRPELAVIVSGGHGLGRDASGPTEAELMRSRLIEYGIASDRIFVEDESRDTIGNALFTALRYLDALPPRPLIIVTSPSHLARAMAVFAFVLPDWPLSSHASARLANEDDDRETRLLAETREFFRGMRPGDRAPIARRLRERWPEYRAAARLNSFA
jgi:uncharacterized SAM-binding protein YcdF (DUF218 family)